MNLRKQKSIVIVKKNSKDKQEKKHTCSKDRRQTEGEDKREKAKSRHQELRLAWNPSVWTFYPRLLWFITLWRCVQSALCSIIICQFVIYCLDPWHIISIAIPFMFFFFRIMENKVSAADFSESYTWQQNMETNLPIKIYAQHQYETVADVPETLGRHIVEGRFPKWF